MEENFLKIDDFTGEVLKFLLDKKDKNQAIIRWNKCYYISDDGYVMERRQHGSFKMIKKGDKYKTCLRILKDIVER